MTLLSGAIQPPLLTLLSSSSHPTLSPLFAIKTDKELPQDSLISSLHDSNALATSSGPHASSSSSSLSSSATATVPKHKAKGSTSHTVVHIQSPTIKTTYIQAGISKTEYLRSLAKGKSRSSDGGLNVSQPLGVELPWLGIQFRTLGRRAMALEFGILDSRGREGIIRCSSFKKNPTIHPYRYPPLVHLPLNIPQRTKTTLNPWLELNLNLPSLIVLFQTLPRPRKEIDDNGPELEDGYDEDKEGGDDNDDDDLEQKDVKTRRKDTRRKRRKIVELPSGGFGSLTYIRVYANCRVRRIWFSAEGDRTLQGMGGGVKAEWGLYASEEVVDRESIA